MRSTASFRGHPIHPAIIPFPFAFLIGSFVFDLLGWITESPALSRTAGHLVIAGLATGVLAAIPGLIDYLYSVPPRSSGKRRATRHALANASALVLFSAAWLIRGLSAPPTLTPLVIQLLAAAALCYGGWQGGVLVTRNMIGVDHRYAQAGKWREARVRSGPGPVVVATVNELKAGQMKLVRYGDRRVVLARTGDGYAAFDDRCSHRGGPLADGVLIGHSVQCLWHGSRFDCRTGQVSCGPADQPIRTYPVSEREDGVAITFESPR